MNKTEAIQALEAAIKQGNEVLNQLKESEPKDGDWCEVTFNDKKRIVKAKKNRNENSIVCHVSITEKGTMKRNVVAYFSSIRKITPEEALPYFKAYFEKQGFKEGCTFKCAFDKSEEVFHCIENSDFKPFDVRGNARSYLFYNDTNTFATLVEEKLEPLTFEACTALVKNNLIVLSNTVSNIMLDHSEIEKLYQYSLKAQGK